jgi:PKD repeat protein
MKYLLTIWLLFTAQLSMFGQNLFLEECFQGGVTGAGRTALGLIDGHFKIKWEENFVLKAAYAVTYRYGRPEPIQFTLNSGMFQWNQSNQIGAELEELAIESKNFAVNIENIFESVTISSDSIYVYMDGVQGNNPLLAQGWYSIYCIFLYESPDITDTTCVRIYTADQVQYTRQDYSIATPSHKNDTDIGLAIHSDRLGLFEDRGAVLVNGDYIGAMWGADGTNPLTYGGVRGHFYYQDEALFGLDDDTANATVNRSDGLAVINAYLDFAADHQVISFFRTNPGTVDPGGANPHPSFVVTYTPECEVVSADVPRTLTRCRGDTIQPNLSGYDHYAWSPAAGLSDTTIANPLCYADTSRWYTVRMWSDDENTCPQTIPIFVDVFDKPEPSITVQPSTCPEPTGTFALFHPDAAAYVVNGDTAIAQQYTGMAAGPHQVAVIGNTGCIWEGTVEVPLSAPVEARFRATPRGGDSPLEVYFQNQSTGATGYEWLIDGVPVSTSENAGYTFADSGLYTVSLVAWFDNPACADTATLTIRVDPGIQVLIPNIITPNNDGRNDGLTVQLYGVKTLRWEIFNRWGNRIHSGTERAEGKESLLIWAPEPGAVSSGTYQVVILAEGLSGRTKSFGVAVMVTAD